MKECCEKWIYDNGSHSLFKANFCPICGTKKKQIKVELPDKLNPMEAYPQWAIIEYINKIRQYLK